MAKKASGTIYPLSALSAMVLHIQCLTTPNEASPAPTPDAIVDLVKALGYVQIDTLHVVNRAHYVTLWARLGSYNIDDFHKLIYTAGSAQALRGLGPCRQHHPAGTLSLPPVADRSEHQLQPRLSRMAEQERQPRAGRSDAGAHPL